MKAWLFQDRKQKKKLGDKAPWSVGWYDPDGKRKEKRIGAHSAAEKFSRRIEGQLAAGTYDNTRRLKWADFKAEYLNRGLPGAALRTSQEAELSLAHFERIIKPERIDAISSRTLAKYVSERKAERRRPKSGTDQQLVSVATVNKELRHLRAVFRKAEKWGYLTKAPAIDFLKEHGKLATYVTPEDFAKLYQAADTARWPDEAHYSPAEWWRALLVFAYMSGWRIGSMMSLRWADVDLEGGFALSRSDDNKGKRDQRIPLHPLVVEHLRPLVCFSAVVFGWSHPRESLFAEFRALQQAAGVAPEGGKRNYGFHDLRRAFATMNAATLTPDALQALMQHKDYQTTQRYINMARQLNPAVQNLFVPELPKVASRA